MAEEAQYSSGPDSGSAKRKYEDQTTPPAVARRPTGFSAPISSQSPDSGQAPPSYNSVPPPLDEIQLAKMRAQEIAARIFNNVEAKRPRVENGGGGGGGGGGSGFDSTDNKGYGSADFVQKPFISSASPGSIPTSYGYQGSSKKIEIPSGRVGVIIGKGGETIKYLQLQSGAKIQVTRDMDADPNSPYRMVELTGSSEGIAKAEQLITDVLAEAESGGSGLASRRPAGQQAGSEQFVMRVPNNKVGLIIGKGGETIKTMQATSGARIQVIPLHPPPGDTSNERTVQIDGTSEQIESAKQLVNEVISENRPRNSSMTGGYSQQGYQARPAGNWAPPGPPMQQPGYGYVQPGAYPGPPQYGMSQPNYGGYPQQPASGGYATTGWDQTTAAANQQQTSQAGGGYDYYNQTSQQQQQAPGGTTAPADSTTGYNYSQQPASGYNQGQAYSQDGYGGYQGQPGYGQPQHGYDQQQGYNTAAGYGNVTNQTTDGHTPSYGAQGDATNQTAPPVQGQQGYNTAPQPSPSPGSGYPVQGSAQPGYAVAPTSQAGYGYGPGGYTQKPPSNQAAYGQPGQSPGAQGGYVQPSYPPPAPTSGGYSAPTAQTGYAQPPYGGAAQAGYGGQPPAYGGGYPQAAPPVYSAADGNSGPASQTAPPSGVAKASPQS